MPLDYLKATDFRCLESAELELDARANLIIGENAAGKTSLLEAAAYLGRGRSFRGASTQTLIRRGCKEFVVFGRVHDRSRVRTLGVRNGAEGIEISIDGVSGGRAADLVGALPLQLIDPEVHELVAGPPERRRKHLDWLAFHVERGYSTLWKRFRRCIKQRNAALKEQPGDAEMTVWDAEFVQSSNALSEARASVFQGALAQLRSVAAEVVGVPVDFEYRRGWPDDEDLADVLVRNRERELGLGSTQAGPHRAELRVRLDDRVAKKLVSRGQQKLLAAAMVIAATAVAQEALGNPLVLLLDDPAAELDQRSLGRLMAAVDGLQCQVIATSLVPSVQSLFPVSPALFHVEHGVVRPGS